jgi:hypothetical protein
MPGGFNGFHEGCAWRSISFVARVARENSTERGRGLEVGTRGDRRRRGVSWIRAGTGSSDAAGATRDNGGSWAVGAWDLAAGSLGRREVRRPARPTRRDALTRPTPMAAGDQEPAPAGKKVLNTSLTPALLCVGAMGRRRRGCTWMTETWNGPRVYAQQQAPVVKAASGAQQVRGS